jgi:hypothetical protein
VAIKNFCCRAVTGMDADPGALPDDIEALKAALMSERARMKDAADYPGLPAEPAYNTEWIP